VDPIYRVVRTNVRGQFATDECFRAWIGGEAGELGAVVVAGAEDPGNDGGPNDHRFYVFRHDGDVPLRFDKSTCGGNSFDLMTDAGRNGWKTEAEAVAVMGKLTGQASDLKAAVDAANKAAVDPVKIAVDAAKDVGKAAAQAVDATPAWLKWAGAGAVLLGAAYVVRTVWRP